MFNPPFQNSGGRVTTIPHPPPTHPPPVWRPCSKINQNAQLNQSGEYAPIPLNVGRSKKISIILKNQDVREAYAKFYRASAESERLTM